MFISHFNRYFEKHARITYFVLLMIIIATFVIFVTPGDVFSSNGRISDFGKMYGRKLQVEQMEKEMNLAMVGIWLQNPQYAGQDFSSNKPMLFQFALQRMRIRHAAAEMGLDNVTDAEIQDAIKKHPFAKLDNPNALNFTILMDYCVNRLQMEPADLDLIIRDNILAERVNAKVRDGVTVTDDEVNAVLARFGLEYATIDLNAASAEPTEADIQAFFKDRKAEIKLPDTKNAKIALFRHANPQDQKAIADLKAKAKALAEQFTAKSDDAKKRIADFEAAAKKAGAAVQASGLISTDNIVAGLTGPQVSLAEAIRSLQEVGEVSGVIDGSNYTAVVCITEKTPTPMPAELLPLADGKGNDSFRQIIADAIIRERALSFFNDNVKQPYDAFRTVVDAVQNDSKLSAQQRNRLMQDAESKLDVSLVRPFFQQEKRSFALVSFDPANYLSKTKVPTAEEIAKEFESRKEEFTTPMLRTSRIMVQTAGLEGDELKAKQDKIANAMKRLNAGEDFAKVAGEVSEVPVTEDKELLSATLIPENIRQAVLDTPVGKFTQALDNSGFTTIYKVLERKNARTLAEVSSKLSEELRDRAAVALAQQDAADLHQKFNDEWWRQSLALNNAAEAEKKEETQSVDTAKLLKEFADKYPAARYQLMTDLVPSYNSPVPPQFLTKVFQAALKNPIVASTADTRVAYVAGLLNITPSRLADPATEAGYYNTLKNLYINTVAMEDAKVRAEAEVKRITEALAAKPDDFAAAAGATKFQALPEVAVKDLQGYSQLAGELRSKLNADLTALADTLSKTAQAGVMLEPIRAERFVGYTGTMPIGYQLIHVESRTVPEATDANAKDREQARDTLLQTKQNAALQAFYQKLEEESNTQLRPGTSYTEN